MKCFFLRRKADSLRSLKFSIACACVCVREPSPSCMGGSFGATGHEREAGCVVLNESAEQLRGCIGKQMYTKFMGSRIVWQG